MYCGNNDASNMECVCLLICADTKPCRKIRMAICSNQTDHPCVRCGDLQLLGTFLVIKDLFRDFHDEE